MERKADDDADGAPQLRVYEAAALFHESLRRARHDRNDLLRRLESAAAHYCREMREQGCTPEHTVREAKRVIHDAIAGDDARVAELAVACCIRHYYRAD